MKVLVDQNALSELITLVAKNMTYIACARQIEAVSNSIEPPSKPEKARNEHDAAPSGGKKTVARADK